MFLGQLGTPEAQLAPLWRNYSFFHLTWYVCAETDTHTHASLTHTLTHTHSSWFCPINPSMYMKHSWIWQEIQVRVLKAFLMELNLETFFQMNPSRVSSRTSMGKTWNITGVQNSNYTLAWCLLIRVHWPPICIFCKSALINTSETQRPFQGIEEIRSKSLDSVILTAYLYLRNILL